MAANGEGAEVLLTICNVCTLNLRQANKKLQEDAKLLNRINDNLKEVAGKMNVEVPDKVSAKHQAVIDKNTG